MVQDEPSFVAAVDKFAGSTVPPTDDDDDFFRLLTGLLKDRQTPATMPGAGLFDGEADFVTHRLGDHFDEVDALGGGPVRHHTTICSTSLRRALEHRLHAAVGTISHPAGSPPCESLGPAAVRGTKRSELGR